MSELGRIVRAARMRSGLSQRAVARRAGTTQAAISRIERGLEAPSFERFAAIVAGLGYAPRIELSPLPSRAEATWRSHDAARRRRLRAAAARPLGENLAEGIALSEFATRFKGAAASGR